MKTTFISTSITHSFLLLPVYQDPYLIVFCESGLEVINVSSAEWVQTIPIRKVRLCLPPAMSHCHTLDTLLPFPPLPSNSFSQLRALSGEGNLATCLSSDPPTCVYVKMEGVGG